MVSLDQLQGAWVKLFFEARTNPNIDPDRLAAPFLSVPPARYDPKTIPSILCVGKATSGDWDLADFLLSPTIEQRRECSIDFLENYVKPKKYDSAFWRFQRDMSRQVALHYGSDIEPLQNIVWTNICKLGVLTGNPEGAYYDFQCVLALDTLRSEIETYRPSLVVLVTNDYGEGLIRKVADDPDDSLWHKEKEKLGFWWREPTLKIPAMLWTYHPERKPQELLQAWIKQACILVGGGRRQDLS